MDSVTINDVCNMVDFCDMAAKVVDDLHSALHRQLVLLEKMLMSGAVATPEDKEAHDQQIKELLTFYVESGRELQHAKRWAHAAAAALAAAAVDAAAQPARPPPLPAEPSADSILEGTVSGESWLLGVALLLVGAGIKVAAPFGERRCAACGAARAGGSSGSGAGAAAGGGATSAGGAGATTSAGGVGKDTLRLTRCRGCGDITRVRYCGAACARDHWVRGGHRAQCEAAQEALRAARAIVRQVEAERGGGGDDGGEAGAHRVVRIIEKAVALEGRLVVQQQELEHLQASLRSGSSLRGHALARAAEQAEALAAQIAATQQELGEILGRAGARGGAARAADETPL